MVESLGDADAAASGTSSNVVASGARPDGGSLRNGLALMLHFDDTLLDSSGFEHVVQTASEQIAVASSLGAADTAKFGNGALRVSTDNIFGVSAGLNYFVEFGSSAERAVRNASLSLWLRVPVAALGIEFDIVRAVNPDIVSGVARSGAAADRRLATRPRRPRSATR